LDVATLHLGYIEETAANF